MPGTPTTNYGWPVPALTGDDANVPQDIDALADAADATVKAVANGVVLAPILLSRASAHLGGAFTGPDTFWMGGNNNCWSVLTPIVIPPDGTFRWNASDYPSAPPGKTAKWRLIASLEHNDVNPSFPISFNVGFRPFAGDGTSGAGGVWSTLTGGGAPTPVDVTFPSPDISFRPHTLRVDENIQSGAPTNMWGGFIGVTASNSVANFFAIFDARLYLVYV